MGDLKKTVWAAGKLFWYLQREFLSLMREFSGGKLKQKGFFHSVAAAVGIDRGSQLSSSCHGRRYSTTWQAVYGPPITVQIIAPLPLSSI